MRELKDANVAGTVVGQRHVEEGVETAVVAVLAEDSLARIVSLNDRMKPAVDGGSQAADDDALALLAGEGVVIDIGAAGHCAADGAVHLDLLRLRQVVVRLYLDELRQVADDKSSGVADAPLIDQ